MRNAYVIAGVGITAILSFAVFKLLWVFYEEKQLFNSGWTNNSFLPVTIAGAAVTLFSGLGFVFLAASRTTQTAKTKKDAKLEHYWMLLQKTGTPEQIQEFQLRHPEFFAYSKIEEYGIENVVKPIKLSTVTVKQEEPTSQPQPKVEVAENEIIIKIPSLQQVSSKQEHNGHNKEVDDEMQQIFLQHLRAGTLKGTFKFKDGKFVIPEDAEFSFVKQKQRGRPPKETSLAVPQEKSKIPRVKP